MCLLIYPRKCIEQKKGQEGKCNESYRLQLRGWQLVGLHLPGHAGRNLYLGLGQGLVSPLGVILFVSR